MTIVKVSYQELYDLLARVLLTTGLEGARAELCARLFADASRDGVSSHGLNRFPHFVKMIGRGVVDVHAQPERVAEHGALERWDGRRGPGNLNAYACMGRAIALSRDHGVGGVALANTNHWMRGGSYGWQAAEAGVIGICWTNTIPNLPPWGAAAPRLGNNPLVIAVPREAGHVVLDMAMSQFSFGALASYRTRGEQLPVAGGFDVDGTLSRDPAAVEKSRRPLPIGFWKGSGLALMLDMTAALLSGGRATHELAANLDTDLSQMFLAFDLSALCPPAEAARVANKIIDNLLAPATDGETVRYPGERTLETRRRNLAHGIPVEPSVWNEVQGFVQS